MEGEAVRGRHGLSTPSLFCFEGANGEHPDPKKRRNAVDAFLVTMENHSPSRAWDFYEHIDCTY
jgi:hypothetical protein